MADVSLRGVCKAFGDVEVLRNVSLDVHDRELVVIVGPSGCGKSTLLRLTAGLEDLTAGEIVIDGQGVTELPPAKRGIAMVFQSYALYPHMNVFDNMAFGLRLAKRDRREIAERIDSAARLLQIDHLLTRKPRELSGGQRQRVAIGRAIVRAPRVFLFDEPLSNLDAGLRVQMRIELARLHREISATTIYVTHDQLEAMTLADRIVVLNAGAVEQVGPPLDLYRSPRNKFVAGFIGSPRMNFMDAHVAAIEADAVTVALQGGPSVALPVQAGDARIGDAVTLGARPEHLRVRGEGTIPGTVVAVEPLGGDTFVYVRTEVGEALAVKCEGSTGIRPAEMVRLGLEPVSCHLFDADGTAFVKVSGPNRD